jgi:hypothetical protein
VPELPDLTVYIALEEINPGGLEVLKINEEEFHRQLEKENHTLKRALTARSRRAGRDRSTSGDEPRKS